jgi:hypothetical protein
VSLLIEEIRLITGALGFIRASASDFDLGPGTNALPYGCGSRLGIAAQFPVRSKPASANDAALKIKTCWLIDGLTLVTALLTFQ